VLQGANGMPSETTKANGLSQRERDARLSLYSALPAPLAILLIIGPKIRPWAGFMVYQ